MPILFGTDAGVFNHGENAREFEYMTEAGMPVMEAIISATITPAIVLNIENESGQIASGFYADIIAVNEDPTQNVSTLNEVVFVMKEGKVYKNK